MNLPLFIAGRYFVSKKSTNVINIISAISVAGVTIGTAALIIVLSVFNGFEGLVVSLYNSFDPHLKITSAEGKSFLPEQMNAESLMKIKGIKYVCPVVEENCLVRYKEKQFIATVKGVSSDFLKMSGLGSKITEGELLLENGDTNFAIVGQGVAYYLTLSRHDMFSALNLYFPKRGKTTEITPEDAFVHRAIITSGLFSIQQDFDAKYIVVPLRFAKDLFSYNKEVTAFEIGLDEQSSSDQVQAEVMKLGGTNFKVQNRFQQHEVLYKIMKSEKWAVYLILTFILLIATFNIIGSLTMLIIDKKKDIAILHALGATAVMAKKIFLLEGTLISLIGAVAGLILGFAVCIAQQTFGLVKLQGSGSFVVDAYPVQVQFLDFVYVFMTVMVIGLAAAWFPAGRLTAKLVRAKINE